MKTLFFKHSLFALLLLSLFACKKEENAAQKQAQLESIGFAGTMPGGRTFADQGIVAKTELTSSSSTTDGSHIAPILVITDAAAGISLKMELPRIKYSDNFIKGEEGDGTELKQTARQFYTYQKVKEKLAVGDKLILSSQTPDLTKSFRLLWIDQKNYKGFTTENSQNQSGSYLEVKELLESTATDPVVGQVKSIDVVFEVDVQLYPSDPADKQPERLKGLLRMKYTEI